jgi:hypothetical protein
MNDCKYFKAKGIDYKGQLQKISKSNTKLQPIYEALTNAFEATKLLSSTENNQIIISLYFDSGLFSDSTQEYSISKIVIEDYGIGFNDKEFDRFTKLHDNSKGFKNQGSGRIQYMHFFNTTKFESTYRDTNSKTGFYKRKFWLSKSDTFIGNDAIICFEEPTEEQTNESKTIVEFEHFLDEEDKKYFSSLTPEVLKETFIEHYLYYFCENRENLPAIHIKSFVNNQNNKATVVTQNDIPQEDKHEEVKIKYKTLDEDNNLTQMDEEETFHIKAFKLNKDLLHSNDLKLTSKHEIVRGKFDKKFELSILKSDDIIDNNRYLFLVSSSYIDDRDTDNRGELKIHRDEEFKNDSSLFKESKLISLDDIQSEINSHILTMYSEILENKQKHALNVDVLQKMFLLDRDTLKKIQINVQDTDEDILKKVYRADAKRVAEKDAKLKEEIEKVNQELNNMNPTDEGYKDELNNKVSSLVKKIPLQNKIELTHSVARRKLVLELFSKILDKELSIQDSSNRNIDEELLHNLIFKQSSNSPDNSDLWLVNEDFIYFKGTSEEQLGQIKIDGESILKDYDNLSQEEKDFRDSLNENRYSKRPDILLFPDEGKCIILEFKNPNVSISSHLQQIQNYATLILNFSKDKFQFNTFYGYFVGEKINPLDVRSHNPNFVESYHFDYLFKPSESVAGFFGKRDANIYIEVIKYSTLLKRAKKRNENFISKLGMS